MSYYLENTSVGYDGRYQIFSPLPVDTSTKEEICMSFKPIAAINNQEVIEFNIPATSQYYTDLSRTKLRVNLRILKENGEKITATDKVGLINYPLNTLFRNVDFCIQQKEISPDVGSNYAYKAILDTLLYKDPNTVNTSLQSAGFHYDTAEMMDKAELGGSNVGLLTRYMRTKESAEASFEGLLDLDATSIKQYLPNGLDYKFKFYPARDVFCLMTDSEENFKVDITSATLMMTYLSPTSELLLGHNEAIQRGPALFAFERSVVKSWVIPKGLNIWSIDSLFADACPSELVIAMTNSSSYTGNVKKNPFNFIHSDLEFLSFNVEGFAANTAVFTPNFEKKLYTQEFMSIFDVDRDNRGLIDYKDYAGGYCIFRVKLNRGVQRDYASMSRKGQTRLTFRFRKSLPEPVTVICYGKFPSTLQIDSNRNVYVV